MPPFLQALCQDLRDTSVSKTEEGGTGTPNKATTEEQGTQGGKVCEGASGPVRWREHLGKGVLQSEGLLRP